MILREQQTFIFSCSLKALGGFQNGVDVKVLSVRVTAPVKLKTEHSVAQREECTCGEEFKQARFSSRFGNVPLIPRGETSVSLRPHSFRKLMATSTLSSVGRSKSRVSISKHSTS